MTEATETTVECQLPPDGWKCTRDVEHDGPCAAIPIMTVNEAYDHYCSNPHLWEIANYTDDGWHDVVIEFSYSCFASDFYSKSIRLKLPKSKEELQKEKEDAEAKERSDAFDRYKAILKRINDKRIDLKEHTKATNETIEALTQEYVDLESKYGPWDEQIKVLTKEHLNLEDKFGI